MAAVALLVAGCGGDEPESPGELAVVATTTIVGDLARQVGGDAASVTQLLKANPDAHEYEPRRDDVVAVAGADVVLQSGDGLDRWTSDVVEQSGTDAPLVDLAASCRSGSPARPRAARPHATPHTGGTNRATSSPRWARSETRSPKPAPFDYLAGRYDLEVVGAVIPSQTTGAQSSAADVADLTRLIERESVKAILLERSLNQKLARAIADEAGVRAGGEHHSDSLGEDGTPRRDLPRDAGRERGTIVAGLTGGEQRCEAPAG